MLAKVEIEFNQEFLQYAIVFVSRPGHLDQFPFVKLVALVFLERVVVELLGCQEDLRCAHVINITSGRLRRLFSQGIADPKKADADSGGGDARLTRDLLC